MRFKAAVLALFLAAAIATLVLSSGPPVSAGIDQPAVVSANPADFTPQIPLGDFSVLGLKQVGSTMYVGGRFSTLGGKSRTNVGAFSATTGVLTSFAPTPNGQVWAMEGLPGNRLAIGGEFTSVNGVARRGLAVVDATTGAVDTAFNANLSGR